MAASALVLCGCTGVATAAPDTSVPASSAPPGSQFDLSNWKITLPLDDNQDGKVDEVGVNAISQYLHPDYFYLNSEGGMVFVAPNKAKTSKNSSNTRSELRQMLRGKNTRIKTHGAGNNFALQARKDSDKFAAIGGKLEAVLRVDHVARNSANPNSKPAYSAVIGQIHAVKYDNTQSGFGYGNEPIKIFFKKFPDHKMGSVFWTYERNLAKNDPNRTDIAYPVWGNVWSDPSDPGTAGIPLGEEFGYTINVYRNTMHLTFHSERLGTVNQSLSLVNNAGSGSPFDALDNRYGYGGDSLYFKAGIYNQCSTKSDGSFWAAACAGTGDWPTDKANGDFAQATFSKLILGESSAPQE
ncbi:MAG: polysaccharide lyase family 7 protein [Erythrobacter sp.]